MFGLSTERLISRIIVLIVAFTVHEFAHAWTATQLGDDTPRLHGRLTLNPLAHLDPLGSLMLLIAGFGWAKPVMVNPYTVRRRTPAGMMLVAVAGPFSNLILAILASIPFRAGLISYGVSNSFLSTMFLEFIWINLILLFFNLIPIFPLDGEKVAEYFLPPGGQDFLYRLRPYGMYILMGLILFGNFGGPDLLGFFIATPATSVLKLLVF
ncbi:MAG: site-2 protease family protein [Anaerolineales bacterium]|nr:MAG: site-2 protease family protein [Anaerolineales bacterium]